MPSQILLDGELLSESQFDEFINGQVWSAILFDLAEREHYLIELFKENDQEWNSDFIRGKLTELEFFKQIPHLIKASIIIKEANTREKGVSDEKVLERPDL